MSWIAALALSFPFPQQAQQEPLITVAGQDFYDWQDYVNSPVFQQLGLRCGTQPPSIAPLNPGDCSLSQTVIKPGYEPAGHPLYRIPVVVHLLMTSTQGNMSDARVQSQIDVMNEDFQALAGTLGANGHDARIEFFLATRDPNGNPTTGITRTTNTNWFNDTGDYWTPLHWDTTRYLNIYTNKASGNLGYVANLPASPGYVGTAADRVVILYSAFGRNAPIGPPYNLGRSATHEVGHFMGLFHTFDNGCGTIAGCYSTGDRICDTNRESAPVFGCPASHTSCGTAQDPYHNYMDYSDDDCMTEFTPEQVNRMRCTLENWRVALPEPPCVTPAAAVTRNGGLNLNVFTATPPVLGSSTTLSVNDATHTSALVVGRAAIGNLPLSNGYVVLNSGTRYFSLSLTLPSGNAVVPVPNDVAICGLTSYTQATLLGGSGTAFSNAVDLTAGI